MTTTGRLGSRYFRPFSSIISAIDSKRGAGIEPGVHDLRAGREPHAVMRGDVADNFVEPLNAMRHDDQIGMRADRHDAAGLRSVGIERDVPAVARRVQLIARAVAWLRT